MATDRGGNSGYGIAVDTIRSGRWAAPLLLYGRRSRSIEHLRVAAGWDCEVVLVASSFRPRTFFGVLLDPAPGTRAGAAVVDSVAAAAAVAVVASAAPGAG